MDEQKILEYLKDYKSLPNNDLLSILTFLEKDFYKTKDLIIKLTHHLDNTEISYNKILEEFNNRTKNV